MEDIKAIVENEFLTNGYAKGETVQGLQLFSYNLGTDYWLVSYGYYDISNQTDLFKDIQKLSDKNKFIDKNISLLIIVDADTNKNELRNTVKIENDKAFFKKYVLPFHPSAAERLQSIMTGKEVQSISDVLMDNECFLNVQSSSDTSTAEFLLYSLAHKLPFIPIKSNHKERVKVELSFEDSDLSENLKWVNDAPASELEMQYYIDSLLSDTTHEECSN